MAGRHGGNLNALARRSGIAPDAILDFSASVNPLGPPESLRAAASRALDRVVHYPDPDSTELVTALAAKHGLAPESIIVGNGSTELLFAAGRALSFTRALIPVPTYVDYAESVRIVGCEPHFVRLSDDADFDVPWSDLESQLQPDDLVFLGQPNNPTGRMFDVDAFDALAQRHPKVTFLVDESFAEFVDGYRSIGDRPLANVIVMRSLTKFYAIPGLRLGYAMADADVARRLRAQILPWSVNVLAQEAAVAFLKDHDYADATRALVAKSRQRLRDRLMELPGFYVVRGDANYLLVRVDRADLDAHSIAERLLAQRIAIRTFTPDQHLDSRYFRVAVRTPDENDRLIDALAGIVGVARGPHRPKRTPAVMFQGTSSNAGKSVLTAALCRILLQDGLRVAPFKSQNMSLNSYVARDGGEMGRAQVVQAQACRLDPDVRMNPILLKPNSDTGCQVIVRGRPVGNMRVDEYVRYKPEAFEAAKQCYDSLAAEFDAIVLEGAGSPGEVNLKSHDIVNMRMAEYAQAPVLVVGDIDRGGVFASFVGTMEVLAPWERKLVAGWVVNRFRGDASLLGSALDYTLAHTGRPVLGVVPYVPSLGLPQEDSVEFKSGALDEPGRHADVEIAVIDLPHISNFTDFDALRIESDVRLTIVRTPADLNQPDALILPGSKNTLGDLEYLRRSGLAERIGELVERGRTEIVGICGGFQMLGREVRDPLGIESSSENPRGLGLLGVSTVMAAEKTLVRTSARHVASGHDVTGYEIHHGQTELGECSPLVVGSDGQIVGVTASDRPVWGTYLHGLFDADGFRRWFIDRLRARRGLKPVGRITAQYDVESALDRLADVVRASLRIDDIYRIMGLR